MIMKVLTGDNFVILDDKNIVEYIAGEINLGRGEQGEK